MPFEIIRSDITKVKADAIVSPIYPEPGCAGGTDAAVGKAAGAEAPAAAQTIIDTLAPGEAAAAAAHQLPAKYVIQTFGPAWLDGAHGELETLRSCYRKSLLLADRLGCESVAFPLIAAGVPGFPRPQALEIALSVFREYLEGSDLHVALVVSEPDSCQLAAGLAERIEEYLHAHYVPAQTETECGSGAEGFPAPGRRRARRDRGPLFDSVRLKAISSGAAKESAPASPAPQQKESSLEDAVNHLGESFQKRLLRMIDESGMTDPEVYKRANVDRKLFSKIRCSEDYIPKKKTIVALAIALRLNLDDAKDLLASAGLLLTDNSKSDVIVRFCIENGIYDIFQVNALLFRFHQPILG